MTTPTFPTDLPGVSTLRWSPTAQVAATDREIGPLALRRRTRTPGALATVTWRLLEGDFAIFQEFWKEDLLRGHRWFYLTLPCAAGFVPHIVRFRSHRSASRDGYGYRTVTGDLYVRERRIRTEFAIRYFTSLPYPLVIEDEIGGGLALPLSGRMWYQPEDFLDANLALPQSGGLVEILVSYALDEELDALLALPLSGTLVDILVMVEPEEELDALLAIPLSGTLVTILVEYSPEESLNANLALPLSGSLT